MELKNLLLQLNETIPSLDEIAEVYANKVKRDVSYDVIRIYRENMTIVEKKQSCYNGEK